METGEYTKRSLQFSPYKTRYIEGAYLGEFLSKTKKSSILDHLDMWIGIHRAKQSSHAIFPCNKDHLCFILYVCGTLLLSSEEKKRLRGLKDLGIYQADLLLEKYAEFFVGGNVIP
jgi:hypothetical protein